MCKIKNKDRRVINFTYPVFKSDVSLCRTILLTKKCNFLILISLYPVKVSVKLKFKIELRVER